MKKHVLLALIGLASFDLPTFAQQTTAPEPKLRQQILTLHKKFDEAWTNKDAAAMAALYTEDAVIVRNDGGPIYGREAIDKYWADVFKTVQNSKHTSEPEQYSPHIIGTWGNQVWSTGEFSETFQAENGGPAQRKGLKFWVQTWNVAH